MSFPAELLQVFVDDFILTTQPKFPEDLKELYLMALAAIYSVFPPPKESGHVNGRDPELEKKMKKGYGRWSHLKVIIGFLFDGRRRSVQLPQDKLNKYLGGVGEDASAVAAISEYCWQTPPLCCNIATRPRTIFPHKQSVEGDSRLGDIWEEV